MIWRLEMYNQNEQKRATTKKLSLLIALIATLVVSITGATYAYFAFSETSNNTITGL